MNERALGEQIFKSFIRELHTLVVVNGEKPDLILGAGDSGAAMVKYTELAFEEFGVSMPPSVVLPTWRHKDEAETILFDNKVFLPQVREVVKNISTLKNVLFVDDEIGSGSMAQAMLDLVLDARERAESFSYFILAESHGFSADKIHGANVVFSPFSQKHEGLWSLIVRLPSEEAMRALSTVIPERENTYKYATNILLNLPVKELVSDEARFTSAYLEAAEREVANLSKLREDHTAYLKALIRSVLFE